MRSAALPLVLLVACGGRLRSAESGVGDAGARPALPGPGPAIGLPDAGLDAGADAPAVDRRPPACRVPPGGQGQAGCNVFVVPFKANGCFVAYLVNPGNAAVHVTMSYHGQPLSLPQYGRRLQRMDGLTSLLPFDDVAGLPPGEAIVVFLNEGRYGLPRMPGGGYDCPIPAVHENRGFDFWPARESTGIGDAYRFTTDGPVVAYQFYGYGRESWVTTASTLLLPQEAWGKSTVVATPKDSIEMDGPDVVVVAGEDGTEVKFRPAVDIVDVDDPKTIVRSGVTKRVVLNAGQFVQFSAKETRPFTPNDMAWPPLSGSVVSASKPVGVMGHSRGFRMPLGTEAGAANQQIPPLQALGHEYAAVRYPDRTKVVEDTPWQIVGAADGTTLSYLPAPPKDAPLTLAVGQVAHFWSKTPFIVKSQDDAHPFYLGGYMTGGHFVDPDPPSGLDPAGRPAFVNVVPTSQYDKAYAFFTDATYPEGRLVIVRKKGDDGRFADVKLGCAAAPLAGFQPLGELEFAQVTLSSAGKPAFAGCDRLVHTIESSAPFAVTVWGWGAGKSLETTELHSAVYAYPAGARARPVNQAPPIVID